MSTADLLKDTLKRQGYSLTAPRQAVFEALQDSEPLLMRDLVRLTATTTDRASVYRTVDLFERLGIIVRLYQGWKYRLELSDLFTHHHHHLTCERCGKTIAFNEPPAFERMVQTIAAKEGFAAHAHQLEVTGICAQCRHKSSIGQGSHKNA